MSSTLSEVMLIQAIALIPPDVWERAKSEGFELVVEGKTLKAVCDRFGTPWGVTDLAEKIGLLEALHWLDVLEYFEVMEYWGGGERAGVMPCKLMPRHRKQRELLDKSEERSSGE